jgi:hypothetical protein
LEGITGNAVVNSTPRQRITLQIAGFALRDVLTEEWSPFQNALGILTEI